MNLEKFKELENSIKEESFGNEYKNINMVMFALTIFGHLASISLAYFLVSRILSAAITDNPIVVFLSTIILLAGLESLKRDVFKKFSAQSIKQKSIFEKSIIPLLLTSILLVSISFYATISGAKEFSSKDKQIQNVAEQTTQKYQDSLTKVYNTQIDGVKKNSLEIQSKIDAKDAEQTQLASNAKLTSVQKGRVHDLKNEKSSLKSDITKNDSTIVQLKSELTSKIKDNETKISETSGKKQDENKTNSFLFVCISSTIELTILGGVFFNRYYKVKSYVEFRERIDKDPNFQSWVLYDSLLDVIYTTDTKLNDKAPGVKVIAELSKLNGSPILQRDAVDFVKVMSSLHILRTSGNARYISKSRETAKEIVKSHFKIK